MPARHTMFSKAVALEAPSCSEPTPQAAISCNPIHNAAHHQAVLAMRYEDRRPVSYGPQAPPEQD